jgi:hypothetical protein
MLPTGIVVHTKNIPDARYFFYGMFGQLKQLVQKTARRQLRASLIEWLETRALQLPRNTREELAKRFGTTPETIDAINQAVKTRAIQESHKFWEENVQ